MEFDRKAPGGGLEIVTTVQNGKAGFQCTFYFQSIQDDANYYLELRIWDRENHLVFRASRWEYYHEPLTGMILHPRLWQGPEDPYLYRVQAVLWTKQNYQEDVLEKSLAFHSLYEVPMKGWFLNDKPIEIRAVSYGLPGGGIPLRKDEEHVYENQLRSDLEIIRDMGANGIFPIEEEVPELLQRMCEELGLIVWRTYGDSMPEFSQLQENGFCTDVFYSHKARWGKEPFVYISKESLVFEAGGTVGVTVYSNQAKVALYVKGDLFEFRGEGPDFVFQGIPAKQLPILLAAETGACSMSLYDQPVHKMFTI